MEMAEAGLQSDRAPGVICTFYSYKGGVGRSMALANVAALLARYGRKVLIIDWDLEAPGLDKYFEKYLRGSRRTSDGLIELIVAQSIGGSLDWRSCLLTATLPKSQRISILHAGRDDQSYFDNLRSLNWDQLFREKNLGRYLDDLREQWAAEYDFVLIDSRTGITDVGGICSILMPDYLLCFFTTNDQSLSGIRDAMIRARRVHAELPLERRRLIVIPIPARDESNTEYKLAAEWRTKFARELGDFYIDWIPQDETAERVLDYLKIPYVPYWSFGEQVTVLSESTDNPKNLAFSYGIITRLINSKLDWNEVREGRRAAEAEAKQDAEAGRIAAEAAHIREQAEQLRLENAAKRQKEVERRLFEGLLVEVTGRYQKLLGRRTFKGNLVLAVLVIALLTTIIAAIAGSQSSPPKDAMEVFVLSSLVAFGAAIVLVAHRRTTRALREEMFNFAGRVAQYKDQNDLQALKTFVLNLGKVANTQLFQSMTGADALFKVEADPQSATVPTDSFDRDSKIAPPPENAIIDPSISSSDSGKPEAGGSPLSAPEDPNMVPEVVITYAKTAVTNAWMAQFTPLLSVWLSESLGRDVKVADLSTLPPGFAERAFAKADSGVVVGLVVVSRRTLSSDAAKEEMWRLVNTVGSTNLIYIILDRDINVERELDVRTAAEFDFSDFVFVGESFSRSERYVEFQSSVRDLAKRITHLIGESRRSGASAVA